MAEAKKLPFRINFKAFLKKSNAIILPTTKNA